MSEAARAGGRPPDVIVVGGGVTGTSISWRLAQAGHRVLLLERRGICAGASGRNAGHTGAGSGMHAALGTVRAIHALTSANLQLLKTLHDELDRDFELRLPGSMNVLTTPEQLAHAKETVVTKHMAGSDVELIDGATARSIMPSLSPRILGATFTRDRGHLWPFALVTGMADAAAREGAEIRIGARVECLAGSGDRVTGVVVNGEMIACGEVVLATNAWTPQLLPELPAGALVPARGQILVTQPLPPLLVCPFGTNFDKEYGRQTPGGQIVCGGYRRLDVDEGLGTYREEVTLPVLAGIARCLTDLFPLLRGKARVVRAWSGIMGFTADGLPLIGRYEPAPGLTIAAGFNGGGFSWGVIVGKIIASLLSGQEPEFDIAPFRPARFHDGDVAWANPFTAGEKNNPRDAHACCTRLTEDREGGRKLAVVDQVETGQLISSGRCSRCSPEMASTVEAGANRMTDDSQDPPLETGWWPTTPVGDTYLRRFLLNQAAMGAAAAHSLGGHSRDLPTVLMADSGRPVVFFNCATLTQPLSTETASATLDEIAEFFAFADPSGQGEVLLISAWPTGDLCPSGWNLMGHPPLHLLPTGAVPRSVPPDLDIEEVRDVAALHAWERVAIEGYPVDALTGTPPGSITSESWLKEPRLRLWVGWVANRPVSASSTWTGHGINNVTLVATVPDARGRGYGEALTWRAALADSSLPAMLISSDVGRPIYERMGFLPLQRITLWYRTRPS